MYLSRYTSFPWGALLLAGSINILCYLHYTLNLFCGVCINIFLYPKMVYHFRSLYWYAVKVHFAHFWRKACRYWMSYTGPHHGAWSRACRQSSGLCCAHGCYPLCTTAGKRSQLIVCFLPLFANGIQYTIVLSQSSGWMFSTIINNIL